MIIIMKQYHAITVKHNKGSWLVHDYEDWIQRIKYEFTFYIFEIDKSGLLHLHGVILGPKVLYSQQLCLEKDLHVKHVDLDTFSALRKWSDYITKDYVNEDEYNQKLCIHETRNVSYPFIKNV